MAHSPSDEPLKLLWTGGWDSTFQLLQLLLTHNCRVTPVYLIAASRLSTGMEIQTMARIKTVLNEKYPHTRELLGPTEYYGMMDVRSDRDIEQAMDALLATRPMGKQYGWFARYCKQFSLEHLQLGVHRYDTPGHLESFLEPYLTEVTQGPCITYCIDEKFRDTPVYQVFRYFTFPIIRLSKLQMGELAKERGWTEELNLTWFCFHPKRSRRGMIACGRCISCQQVTESGLACRIPMTRRISTYCKNGLRQLTHPTRRYLRKMLFSS